MRASRPFGKTSALIAVTLVTSIHGVSTKAAEAPWLSRINGANFDDVGTHVAIDRQGNAIVAASSVTEFGGALENLLLKYDRNGTLLWRRGVAAGIFQSKPSGFGVDPAGNIFLAGVSQPTVDATTASFVAKFDPNGVELWRRRLEEPNAVINLSDGLAVDSQGNVVVAATSLLEGGTYDFLVAKYDGNGNEVWRRRYDSPARLTDTALAIGVDASSNVYVAGNSTSSGPAGVDFLTLKYNPSGALLWARRAEPHVSGSHQHVNALAVDPTGGVAVIGFADDRRSLPQTVEDIYIVKYDARGDLAWSYLRNGSGQFPHDYGQDIAIDAQGNVHGVGTLWETDSAGRVVIKTIVVKFDATGRVLWEQTYAPPAATNAFGKAIALDIAGNVFVGGSSINSGSYPAGQDYLTLKYSPTGALLWTQQYSGPGGGADEIADVAADSDGDVVVTGNSFGGFDTFADVATLRYVNGAPFPGPTSGPASPALPERLAVSKISTTRGRAAGGVLEIEASDDRYLTLTRGDGRGDTSTQVVLEATTKHSAPTAMQTRMEAAHGARVNIDQTIEYFNFRTGAYELISRGRVQASDTVTDVAAFPADDLQRFVQPGTGTVRARATFSQPAGSRTSAWQVRIDQLDWRVSP